MTSGSTQLPGRNSRGDAVFKINETTLHRVQLARITPARMTEVLRALETAINKYGTNDASITLEYTQDGDVFTEVDLVPVVTIGLRKAIPSNSSPGLVLPGDGPAATCTPI